MLVLVTALVWAAHYDRWTLADWRLPTDYVGDANEILARIKAASEGDTWPLSPQVIERLGAPFGAHWNAYPTPDKPMMLLMGGLARVVGVFAASNFGLLLAQVSAALAFYFAARWLRVRWEWAWAGALLFAYTYHSFHRGLAHFSFVFTWTVPIGLLAVWLVAQSRRLRWREAGAWVCLGAGLALGCANPYLLLFWGQLLCWALLTQWFGRRRPENLQIGVAAGLVALAAFLVTNAEVWIYVQEPEGLPLLLRNYGGTERYALKPVEMFIPPGYHRWDLFAFLGHRYQRWSDWRGEAFLPYLGLFGIAGFLWLLGLALHRLLRRRALPGSALASAWLLAYSSVGGVTNMLAFFAGFQIFRATNRVAIFLSAIVLCFLVVRLSRLSRGWPPALRIAAALAMAGLGLADQLPRPATGEKRAQIAREVASDRKLAAEVEAALPPGAMVFQLPVLGFPEVVPPFRLADYEHFRPYLVTDGLRFSYGAAKYRARSRWQRDLENVPTETLVRRLESYGFAALYLNRKGFEDRAEKLLGELAALGYVERWRGGQDNQVVVRLRPEARPKLPLGRYLTYGQGWQLRPERGVRWAEERAVLSYFNPHDAPIGVRIRLDLVAASPREVTVRLAGRELGRVRVAETTVELLLPMVELAPGVNVFTLHSSEPAQRRSEGRNQLRAFGLEDASIRMVSLPPDRVPVEKGR